MRKQDSKPSKARVLLVIAAMFTIVGTGAPALGVDGVIEINQAVVDAAGGFPYVINVRGSYRLTGNLTVSDTTKHAIQVSTSSVTIDLNGFGIFGPVTCSGTPTSSCNNTGAGNGINANNVGALTVRNGTVRGIGNHGILMNGGVLENVEVVGNGGDGINVTTRGIVRDSRSVSNLGAGIRCGERCTVDGNIAGTNGGGGIVTADDGLIRRNNVSQNTGNGITATRSVISGNSSSANSVAGIAGGGSSNIANNNVATNQSAGIACTECRIAGNTSKGNVAVGAICTSGDCLITDNIVSDNQGQGISAAGGGTMATGNVIEGNVGFGLALSTGDAYRGNNLNNNNGANPEVQNGINLGDNICGTALCP